MSLPARSRLHAVSPLVALVLATVAAPPLAAQGRESPLPSIAERTEGMQSAWTASSRSTGSADTGQPLRGDPTSWAREMIHYDGDRRSGLGSNDLGLDRGALGRLAHRASSSASGGR
jgi:hypothetical protein